MMENIDCELISYCGLYCGECDKYKKGKCIGCRNSDKLSWCKIRECCKKTKLHTCAECKMQDVNDCKKFNNIISKFFAFVFKSDRRACINRIREIGEHSFVKEMSAKKAMTIKKK